MKKFLVLLISLTMILSVSLGSVGTAYADSADDISLNGATVALSQTVYRYSSGNARTPGVTSVTLEDSTVLDPTDYTVTYSNNSSAGVAKVTVTAKADSGYTGSATADFYILGLIGKPYLSSKTGNSVTLSWPEWNNKNVPIDGYMVYAYGNETPIATVNGKANTSYTINELQPNTDYKFRVAIYKHDDVTNEDVRGTYSSTHIVSATTTVSLNGANIVLKEDSFKYTGSPIKPVIESVSSAEGYPVDPESYTVSYSDNTKAGTGTLTITGKSESGYNGTTSVEFYILGTCGTPSVSSKTSNSVTLKWPAYTKGPIDGYKIYEYNSETGENKVVKTVSGATKTTGTVKGLEPNTTHTYLVAVYKKDSFTGKAVIGKFSKGIVVTTDKISLKTAKIVLEYNNVAYDGYYKKPKVKSVKLADGTLVPSTAYTVSYANNKYYGFATVTVKPKATSVYKDNGTAKFYIIKRLAAPKRKSRTATSITLTWEKHPGTRVSGYKIYKKSASGEYRLYKTVSGVKTTSYKVKGLTQKKGYRFKVAAYVKDASTGKVVIGKQSTSALLKTLPKKPARQEIKLTLSKPYITVDWNSLSKKKATQFEIWYATNSSFTNPKKVLVKNDGKVDSYDLKGLSNGTRYYVKVRALNTYDGYTAKGKWSPAKSKVASTSGWCTIDGRKYYYRGGAPVKGNQTINGETYYFDGTTGECHGATATVWDRVKATPAGNHKYLVSICISRHRINVFQNVDGHWAMMYQWSCTTGLNDEVTEAQMYTPRGSYAVRYKTICFGDTYSVWYATNFTGPFYIHSILYNHGSKTVVQDGRLGISASHGCVRTSLAHAKWIYNNVGKGCPVISTKN